MPTVGMVNDSIRLEGRTMKLALATWNGRISPVFDVARQVQIVEIKDNRIFSKHKDALPGTNINLQASRLSELGAEVLICGAISCPLKDLLTGMGLKIISFTAGDIDQVLGAWLVGSLPNHSLSMPGCCKDEACCGKRRRGGRRRREPVNRRAYARRINK